MTNVDIIINHNYSGLNPLQFGYEECKSGHCFGPAVRTHWLLHYVVQGFGRFHRDGKIYEVGPGEIFVIPPYLETYYEADSQQPWQYYWVWFTTESALPAVFSKAVISCPNAGEVFESMRRVRDFENGRSAYLSGCLWILLGTLLEQDKPTADYVEKACNCMRSEYMTGITVQQIANRLNLERSYFSTLFRKKRGISPQQYLKNIRLEKAADLLVNHGEKPSMAAVSVGYSDLYHFSKIFKQHFGLSPRAYQKREMHKNQNTL